MIQRLRNLFCLPHCPWGEKWGKDKWQKEKFVEWLVSGIYFTLSITNNAPTRFTPHIKHQSGVRVWAPKPKNKTFAIDWLLIYPTRWALLDIALWSIWTFMQQHLQYDVIMQVIGTFQFLKLRLWIIELPREDYEGKKEVVILMFSNRKITLE